MLDGFRAELDDHVDTIAERAQIGGTAYRYNPGRGEGIQTEALPDRHLCRPRPSAALIERYGDVANLVRKSIIGCRRRG